MPHASDYELEDRATLHHLQNNILNDVFYHATLSGVTGYWAISENDTERLGHALEAIERKLLAGYGRVMVSRLHGMRAALISRIRVCEGKRE